MLVPLAVLWEAYLLPSIRVTDGRGGVTGWDGRGEVAGLGWQDGELGWDGRLGKDY